MFVQLRLSSRRALGLLATSSLAILALSACGHNYCQHGPKHGTQCFSINDVEWQKTQVRGGDWPEERRHTPAPGCVLATPSGLVQQPLPTAAASSTALPGTGPAPPPVYLMSGDCVSREERVHGAVR